MACATLKRSLDWEALNQRPTKRRRCSPFAGSPQTNQPGCSRITDQAPSAFADTSSYPKLTPGNLFFTLNIKKKKIIKLFNYNFTEKMVENIREEITRLHRSKQLTFSTSAIERMQDSESSGSEMGPDSPRRPESPPSLIRNPDKGLFTFKQVSKQHVFAIVEF